jgi:hypothetical protein
MGWWRNRLLNMSFRLSAGAYLKADGWNDIFIASGMSYPYLYLYGINSLLLNDHEKKFEDAEFVVGIEPRKNPYTPWFEIDCSDPHERQAQQSLRRPERQIDRDGATFQSILGHIPIWIKTETSTSSPTISILSRRCW